MTKIFFTSDNHYFHENIIKYCNRPFSNSVEMNQQMVHKWNELVSPDDWGIFVGDLSAGLKGRHAELKEIIQSLNGRKILIRGNHDHQPNDWYIESGFLAVFDFLNLDGVILSHYPIQELIGKNLDISAFGSYELVIHGHVHANTPNFEKHFNVAADRNNFIPWSYQEIIPLTLQSAFRENIENLLINTSGKISTI
jgi:calcineurin-like phosphoesterase family protein